MLTAIVTGVSRGLGEALGAQLLERGCRVVGIGRNTSARLGGDRYTFVRCDLGDAAALAERAAPAFAHIAAERAEAICLINNAATLEPVGVLGTLGSVDIARSITVNLVAPIGLSSLFCNTFDDDAIDRRIINVSSGAAQSTLPGASLYCIAKAGLEMLTRSLAAEHPSPSFRAITLRPGIIDTDMQVFARSQTENTLPSVDLFKGFHASGNLVPPDTVARKVVDRLVFAAVEQGRTYSYAEL
ncbi:MAG TPA: SDR family NAD(P)-dependent oxidoreductase [Casimicrobiaceae bacterium]|nr:SDR family NAD(P)-dependent oxidoreductase [Casimicrobiaceae bacterium]